MSVVEMKVCQLEKVQQSQGPIWDNPTWHSRTPLKTCKWGPQLVIRCN